MARTERFTFLCDAGERRAITDLAAKLHRSQSDAVRFIVILVAKRSLGVKDDLDILRAVTDATLTLGRGGEPVVDQAAQSDTTPRPAEGESDDSE